jgi:MFS family permease
LSAYGPGRLSDNRDFNLLWIGQAASSLGSRVSGVAYPLLVLVLTHSPTAAGFVAFAELLPTVIFQLPAGVAVDRWDRKKLMMLCDVFRAVAVGSVAVATMLGFVTLSQIVIAALIEGTMWTIHNLAERTAILNLVHGDQVGTALAVNQARTYGAIVAGPPIGGILFQTGKHLPFVFDFVSYVVSLLSLVLIRTEFQQGRDSKTSVGPAFSEGIRWFWAHPFMRDLAFLVAATDFSINGLWLVLLVGAQRLGASAGLIGAMFGLAGAGGLLGAMIAPQAVRRIKSAKAVVYAVVWISAVLAFLLAFAPNAVALGILYGLLLFVWPTWNAIVTARRIRAVPDSLRGRVQSAAGLVAMAPVPFASLLAGLLLQSAGVPITVAVFSAIFVVAGIWARFSRGVSQLDALPSAG